MDPSAASQSVIKGGRSDPKLECIMRESKICDVTKNRRAAGYTTVQLACTPE